MINSTDIISDIITFSTTYGTYYNGYMLPIIYFTIPTDFITSPTNINSTDTVIIYYFDF